MRITNFYLFNLSEVPEQDLKEMTIPLLLLCVLKTFIYIKHTVAVIKAVQTQYLAFSQTPIILFCYI